MSGGAKVTWNDPSFNMFIRQPVIGECVRAHTRELAYVCSHMWRVHHSRKIERCEKGWEV